MPQRWSKTLRYSLILGVVLCSVLSLGGYDAMDFLANLLRLNNGNEARAQQEGIIETFQIRAATFRITTNAILEINTNVEVKDQVTIYKQIDGNMRFTLTDGATQNFEVTPVDIVIERPALGLLTFIRKQ
jgi:hypothetical protein